MREFDDIIKKLKKNDEVPQEVWRKFTDTLDSLPKKESGGIRRACARRKYWRAAVLAAAVCVLGTTVFAAGKYFGLFDFANWSQRKLPEEAKMLIETDISQTAVDVTGNNFVEFTVKEALCDSKSLFLVIEASAKESGKYFFMPTDAVLEDPVSNWGIESGSTVAEYVQENGLEPVAVNAGVKNADDLGIAVSNVSFRSASDDVMDIMIESGKNEEGNTLGVVCNGTARKYSDASVDAVMRSEIRFTLTDISKSERFRYVPDGAGTVEGCEVQVTAMEMILTELGTYVEVYYKAPDSQEGDALYRFRLLDGETGEALESFVSENRWSEESDGYIWRESFAGDIAENSCTLEIVDWESGESCGTVFMRRE